MLRRLSTHTHTHTHTHSPPMPQNQDGLRIHIQDACESSGMQMLSNVWIELVILTCVESPVGFTLKSDEWYSRLWEFLFMLYKFYYCAYLTFLEYIFRSVWNMFNHHLSHLIYFYLPYVNVIMFMVLLCFYFIYRKGRAILLCVCKKKYVSMTLHGHIHVASFDL
jgi:hypothetical protein